MRLKKAITEKKNSLKGLKADISKQKKEREKTGQLKFSNLSKRKNKDK